ncbi:MAG TPA: hypothetical protein VF796_24810 [Humisphaera sp.]
MARSLRSLVLVPLAAGYLSYAALCVAERQTPKNWRVAAFAPVTMPMLLTAASIAYVFPIEPPPRVLLRVGWTGYLAPFVAAGISRGLRHRRENVVASRAARGLCAACGHDLRGTPGRCPKCGATPESSLD